MFKTSPLPFMATFNIKKDGETVSNKASAKSDSKSNVSVLNTEHSVMQGRGYCSILGSELIGILDSCIPVEEGRRIRACIRRCLFPSLLHLYDEIFISSFVKREDFKNFLEKTDQYYGQHYEQCHGHTEDKAQGDGLFKTIHGSYAEANGNAGGLFKSKSYNASTFVVPMDQFKKALINDHIRKSDILADPKRYARLSSLINLLKSLKDRLESKEINFLLELYELSFSRQLLLDFFYYFDLLYRQGSYFYYLKLCCEILEIKEEIGDNEMRIGFVSDFEDCFENYCKNNIPSIVVKNRRALDQFIEALSLLAEIEGEGIDISRVLEFFKNIQKDKPDSSKAKILLQKIN